MTTTHTDVRHSMVRLGASLFARRLTFGRTGNKVTLEAAA